MPPHPFHVVLFDYPPPVILSVFAAYQGRTRRNPVARKENRASSIPIAFMTDPYAIIIGAASMELGENGLVLGQIIRHRLCLHEPSFHIEH
jgi:hypothetical protein